MSKLPNQITRKALIDRFKAIGFTGPHAGVGKHPEFMSRGEHDVKLPNVHSKKKEIGQALLRRMLQNSGLDADELFPD